MPEILFVINNISYGGASKITVWLAEKLLSAGYNVSIMTNTSNCKKKIPQGVSLIENRQGRNFLIRNTWGIIHTAQMVKRYIREHKVTLVISYGDHIFYSLILLRLVFKYRLLVAERTDPFSSKGFSDVLRRYLFKFADYFVFQTQEASEYFSNQIRARSFIINNPVIIKKDLQKWCIDKTRNIILSAGRLDVRQKRQDILIKAFAVFSKKEPSYELWIAGDGTGLSYLKEVAKKENVLEKVHFLGFQEDLQSLFLMSKLFVLSSDYEGIPNILIEALQHQVPIVSTDCSPGGARLLLDNGVYGVLIPRHDYMKLADSIMECVSSNDKLIYLSEKTQGALIRFDEKNIAEAWLNCFSHIIYSS